MEASYLAATKWQNSLLGKAQNIHSVVFFEGENCKEKCTEEKKFNINET